MPLPIRPVRPADLDAVISVYNASIPGRSATADLDPVSAEERRGWLSTRPPHRPLWVREDDGRLCAWLALEDFSTRAAYRPTAEIAVYVAPGEERRGHGRALLRHAVRCAPRCSVDRLLAKVFSHNAASVGLFAAEGFARWGLLPGVCELDGVRRDVLVLGRRVPG